MTTANNKALVTAFFAAITDGEFDQAADLVAPAGRWFMPRRGVTNTLAQQVDIMRDEHMTFAVEQLTAEDDRVSALVSGFMSRPDGRRHDKTYHFLIKAEAGRIVDVAMYDDGSLADRIAAESA